jgi:hypothetical protein
MSILDVSLPRLTPSRPGISQASQASFVEVRRYTRAVNGKVESISQQHQAREKERRQYQKRAEYYRSLSFGQPYLQDNDDKEKVPHS